MEHTRRRPDETTTRRAPQADRPARQPRSLTDEILDLQVVDLKLVADITRLRRLP